MATAIAPLCAEDIMCSSVVTIAPHESLRDAVAQLSFNHVSGLPVLDSEDRCIGVISASDIVSFEDDHALGIDGRTQVVGSYFDPDSHQWETVRMMDDVEVLSEVKVSEEMSREIVAVSPEDSLESVARKLLVENVHRILVLDDNQKLRGVISASDFVRLFVEEN